MSKNRDFWDKLNILATLSIAALIGYWGYINNDKIAEVELQKNKLTSLKIQTNILRDNLQLEINKSIALNNQKNMKDAQLTQKLSVIETFISHLSNIETRKVAIVTIASLGDEKLAIKFADLYNDEQSKEAIDIIYNRARGENYNKSINKVNSELENESQKNFETGWVYLGRIEKDGWKGNYIDLKGHKNLESIINKTFSVREDFSLNVRTDHPSKFLGNLRPIKAVLSAKSKIIIEDTYPTLNNYIWAKVRYTKEHKENE